MASLVRGAAADPDWLPDDPVAPPQPQEEAKHTPFQLQTINAELQRELDAFHQYRTDPFVPERLGIRVELSTWRLDRDRLLRFLGFLVHRRETTASTITLKCVFAHRRTFKRLLRDFIQFLVEDRRLKSSTIAGYMHSLGVVARFMGDPADSRDLASIQRWLGNVEKQAQSYRDIENTLQGTPPDFVSWYELQIARVKALAAYDAMPRGVAGSAERRAKAEAAQRLVAILLFTTGPVARITILRLLQFDTTLKWRQEAERWVIDLTSLKYVSSYHKTLKKYGRYVLPLARLDGVMDRVLREHRKLRGAFLDPNRPDAEFVFIRMGRRVRRKNDPYDGGGFSKFVKSAFQPWTPDGRTPTPRLFRKIFETFIRTLPFSDTAPLLVDSPEAQQVFSFHERLKDVSAEYLFHSITTANKTYDLRTYQLAKLSKLVDWMDIFSAQFTMGEGGEVVVSALVQGWKALNEVVRDEERIEQRAWDVMEQRRPDPGAAAPQAVAPRSGRRRFRFRLISTLYS